MNFEPVWVFVGLDSNPITDLSLPTDACLRCQTEGKQEECVGKKLTPYSEDLHYQPPIFSIIIKDLRW